MSEAKAETKRCSRCKEEKSVTAFTKTDRWCKACRKEVNVVQYGNRRRGHSLEDAFDIKF